MPKIKIPEITQGLRDAVKTWLKAHAYCEAIRPDIESYLQKIIDDGQFKVTIKSRSKRDGDVVKRPFDIYMASDDDVDTYIRLAHEQHIAHGFEVEYGHNPLSMAEDLVRDAGAEVINQSAYMSGLTSKQVLNISKRDQLIKLTVEFVLAQCPEITTEAVMEHKA